MPAIITLTCGGQTGSLTPNESIPLKGNSLVVLGGYNPEVTKLERRPCRRFFFCPYRFSLALARSSAVARRKRPLPSITKYASLESPTLRRFVAV